MQWIAEHAQQGYGLFVVAIILCVGMWWIDRKIAYLFGALGAAAALLGFWLVVRNVVTDEKQIQLNVQDLAKALLAKDRDKARIYVADELKYRRKGPDKLYDQITEWMEDYGIDDFRLTEFEVKSHSRAEKKASVFFHVDVRGKGKALFAADCPWKLVLEDDQWKLNKITLQHAVLKADKDVPVTGED